MDVTFPFGREIQHLRALAPSTLQLLSGRLIYADLFYEHTIKHAFLYSLTSENGTAVPFTAKQSRLQGLGIYGYNAEGRAYHAIQGCPTEREVQNGARQLLLQLETVPGTPIHSQEPFTHFDATWHADSPLYISQDEKKSFIAHVVDTLRSYDPTIKHCSVEYQDISRHTYIANTDGADIVRLNGGYSVHVCVSRTSDSPGKTLCFTRNIDDRFGPLAFDAPGDIARQSLAYLDHWEQSRPIPSGTMDVVFAGTPISPFEENPSSAGLWLHEAIGHLLEADQAPKHFFNAPSPPRLAHVPIQILDNPKQMYPTHSFSDDEGTVGTSTLLIDEGRVQQLLTDHYHAYRKNIPLTGNGRRQDYRHAPLPRMTHLSLAPGTTSAQDILSEVSSGIYVTTIKHGHTLPYSEQRPINDPTAHFFELEVERGYAIEQGKLTHPVSDLTIRGNGLAILNSLAQIGSDMPKVSQRFMCLKDTQAIPVSVASPTVLIPGVSVLQRSM